MGTKRIDYIDFLDLAKKSIANRIHVGGGSFESYKEYVESFKSNHSEIIDRYDLTDSELFVMFMMVIMNDSDIQKQFFPGGKSNSFTIECAELFDSFLQKIPSSSSPVLYAIDKRQRIENFDKKSDYVCTHYLAASTNLSVFNGFQKGVKYIISRRLIGKSKAHELFQIFNGNNEFLVYFEKNTKFEVNGVNKDYKTVELTEL